MLQWFISFTEFSKFLFYLGKIPLNLKEHHSVLTVLHPNKDNKSHKHLT